MGGSSSTGRGKTKGSSPRAMTPVEDVDISAVRYKPPTLQAPHLTGFSLRAFVWLMESPLLGPLITSVLKSQNNMPQVNFFLLISYLHPSWMLPAWLPFTIIANPSSLWVPADAAADGDPRAPHVLPGVPTAG